MSQEYYTIILFIELFPSYGFSVDDTSTLSIETSEA